MVSVVEHIGFDNVPRELISVGLDVMVCANAHDLPSPYVQQLADKSRQPHIMEHEGHEDVGVADNPGRFRDVEAFRNWSANKQRILYMLIKESSNPGGLGIPDIGGIIWFGERRNEHAPGMDLTFAIRNYAGDEERQWGQYRGQGLGTPFMQAAHADLASRHEYQEKGIWLDLVEGNIPAERLYTKNGYREVCRVDDEEHPGRRRIVMANDSVLLTQKDEKSHD